MEKQTIAITGMNGVVGRVIAPELLQNPRVQLIDLFHTKPAQLASENERVVHHQLDLLNNSQIVDALVKIQPQVLIHLAAITHLDRCETQREQGRSSESWHVNVDATSALAHISKQLGAHLIFLSTECVFDGDEKSGYHEQAPVSPKSWYGLTKAEAEKRISETTTQYSIVRAVIAYHQLHTPQTLVHQFTKQVLSEQPFSAVVNQRITPTFMPDIAKAINTIIDGKLYGYFHIASPVATTPLSLARLVSRRLNKENTEIKPAKLEVLLGSERAKLRLRHAVLKSTLTQNKLGLRFSTPSQAL